MNKKTKPNSGDNIKKDRGGWDFDIGVAKTFDNHVKKSVPLYDEGHQIIVDSSDYFIKKNSNVYDIGCSTGKLIERLSYFHKHKENINFFGIDSSKEMITSAKKNNIENSRFTKGDITKVKLKQNSMTVLYYTLQFIDTAYRQEVVNKIYNSLEWGGALFLFEKVRAADARFQDITTTTYEEFKVRNNFTNDEIMSKKRSLVGILEPFSTQGNLDMLKRAGFVDINSIFKYICFEGFLAIK
tara:strand:- start:28635 stop:29357 length:723 start_codon:yes stop_codon:yes gene_type:complete